MSSTCSSPASGRWARTVTLELPWRLGGYWAEVRVVMATRATREASTRIGMEGDATARLATWQAADGAALPCASLPGAEPYGRPFPRPPDDRSRKKVRAVRLC